METQLILCACHNSEHQMIFMKDEEDNLIYVQVHLTKKTFWKRFKYGIKYIFGYQSRYGAFDEIVLDKSHASYFIEIVEFLKNNKQNKL